LIQLISAFETVVLSKKYFRKTFLRIYCVGKRSVKLYFFGVFLAGRI
jgi:hypothetical protein